MSNHTTLVTVVKQNDLHFNILSDNGKKLGELLQDVDGFLYFWPSESGCWNAHIMHAIADKLDELNKPWQDVIDASLDSQRL